MAPPAVTNASIDPGDPHVVALQTRRLTCGPGATPDCTGTLVAPRVVVTAAHCVDNGPPEGVQVFVGTDVDLGGEVTYALDVTVHPLYDPVTLANDLAVVVLATPLPHPPAPLLTSLDEAAVGSLVRVVGFGADGSDGVPGIKRTGAATLSAIGPDSFEIAPGPSMSCHGDSGGPVFLEVDGVEYLAGVTSSGDAACLDYGSNVRVDTQLATFLLPTIDAAADAPEPTDEGPIGTGSDAVCGETCATDDDCPADHSCSDRGDGMRCRYQDFPSGYLAGSACDADDACDGGMCVAVERAGQPECVCYTLCTVEEPPVDKAGCGCASTGPGAGWIGVAAVAVVVRRVRVRTSAAPSAAG